MRGGTPPAGAPVPAQKPRDRIAALLASKGGEIAKLLPRHLNAERLLKVAQIAATTTPALAECDVPSLIGAIGQCAQFGLEPNTVLGHAYLVPFNVKRKRPDGREEWVKSVQVVIGYKGLIDLARRSGQIISISAHGVHANDKFEVLLGTEQSISHVPALTGERGALIAFYAVAKLKDGGTAFEVMTKAEVDAIKKETQSKGNYGPWKDHYEEMGRKTAIRRLAKYLPLSVEFQTAAAVDAAADAGKSLLFEQIDGELMPVGEITGSNPEDEQKQEKGDQQQAEGQKDEPRRDPQPEPEKPKPAATTTRRAAQPAPASDFGAE